VDAKKKETKSAVTARKEDVKYIKCGVCEEIVKQLSRQVKKKRDKIAPKKVWLSCMCSLVSFLLFSSPVLCCHKTERKKERSARSVIQYYFQERRGRRLRQFLDLCKNPNLSSLAAS
jgi:hypothetical protein